MYFVYDGSSFSLNYVIIVVIVTTIYIELSSLYSVFTDLYYNSARQVLSSHITD